MVKRPASGQQYGVMGKCGPGFWLLRILGGGRPADGHGSAAGGHAERVWLCTAGVGVFLMVLGSAGRGSEWVVLEQRNV